jgi:hypothetical protein
MDLEKQEVKEFETAIARHYQTWVRKWRKLFAHHRLAGLYNRAHSGRPRRLPQLQQVEIVALACTPPAEAGRAWVRWSVQALHDEIERRHMATLHRSKVSSGASTSRP